MNKALKLAVPTIQLLCWAAMTAWGFFPPNETVYRSYFSPLKSVVMQVNYPILLVWSPILYGLDRLPASVSSFDGLPASAATIAGILLFALSLVLFWYFTLREIELRLNGKSLFRTSGRAKQIFVFAVLLFLGLDAWFKAYGEARRLWYVGRFEGIFNSFLLMAWGVIFIGIAIHDLRSFRSTDASYATSATT